MPGLGTFSLYTLPDPTLSTCVATFHFLKSAEPWLNSPTNGVAIHPISQVTQLARAPPCSFAAISGDEPEAGGDTQAECIRRWEGRYACGYKEVESPTWGKVGCGKRHWETAGMRLI